MHEVGSEFKTVWLRNIPVLTQGSHDGLCLYYAASMMLLTLLPHLELRFGEGRRVRKAGLVVDDPLLRNFAICAGLGGDAGKALSSWFFGGANVKAVQKALNRVMREEGVRTRTIYAAKNKVAATFDYIAASIDNGLPIVLAWDSDDFGTHAVLVYGYIRSQGPSQLDWLAVNDPSDGKTQIAWRSLCETMRGRFEVIRIDERKQSGPRPDRVVRREGEPKQVERWWHRDGVVGWVDTQKLFELGASSGDVGSDEDLEEIDS